ncbi:MAG: NAD-dependent epimerase/dehydratase family protein [Helicobacteraceae bacterium]|jgi:nucleoside-diphosphate-sugar epimerase|nr:NAD-dependent epimerase/dehydratase family protein [Helicobacteraceae bacterium]
MNKIIAEDIQNILSEPLPWGELDGKTVLITGATSGFLSYIAFALLELKTVNVIAVVRNIEKAHKIYLNYLNNGKLRFFVCDVSQKADFNKLGKIDYIIHGAMLASPINYVNYPMDCVWTAVFGSYRILEFAKEINAKVFLTSSSSVYGEPKNENPVNEDDYGKCDPTNIRAFYAESKRIQETLFVAGHKQHHLDVFIGRFPNMYGPNTPVGNGQSLGDFIANVLNNEDIIIRSDGLAKREYLYISDAAGALFTILLKGKVCEPYNVAANSLYTMKELAQNIQEAARIIKRYAGKILILNEEDKQGRQRLIRLNAQRLNAIGWTGKTDLFVGLRRYFEQA